MVTSAWTSEAGLTLICPKTQLAYTPARALIETIEGTRYVQSACRWCDANGYTRTDRGFNPSIPQIHTHMLPSTPQACPE